MHIQTAALLLLGLLATAGSAPLNDNRHLIKRSLSQAAEKRQGYDLAGEIETTKREDAKSLISNAIVKYSDDKIAKREDDNGAVVNQIVRYTDDEITKSETMH